jgi:hypothetical protein
LFTAYQKRQPFCENHFKPCPIIDNPDALKEIIEEGGPNPLYPGADTIISEKTNTFLNKKVAQWAKVSDPIWEKKIKKETVK